MKKLITRFGGAAVLMAVTATVTLAAAFFTFPINGNTVSAASAALTVTTDGKPLNGSELLPGTWTSTGTVNVTNTGSKGALTLVIGNLSGTICSDTILEIKKGGVLVESVAVTAHTINLGDINHNGTVVLTQRAQLSSSSTANGGSCTWDETVRLDNN